MEEKQILLVNDDPEALKRLDRIIQSFGFRNTILANGADNAFIMVRSNKVDCIISAYEMSEMSGIALLKIIRRDEPYTDRTYDKSVSKACRRRP